MKLKSLELKNYRNIQNLSLDMDCDKILIIGKNAQGKTNILESIYFLSTLKSSRTTNISELINFQAENFEISSVVLKSNTDIELDYSYNSEKKKNILLNKVKSKVKDFKNVLKTVLFSSSDLMLLRGSPEVRRNWLDTAISQIYPAYDDRLNKYDKIRIQKNNFLKDCLKNDIKNNTLLEVYNEQLVVTGSNIIYLRIKFLKEIEKIATSKHKKINEEENLKIKYFSKFDCDLEEKTIEEIAEIFKSQLKEKYIEEQRRGQCCSGPHRDDILFSINSSNASKFASQGQQRTVVLALKLAELDIITQKTGEEPILLLDDVLAELDDLRQNYLLKSINSNIQTIITSVDTLLFDDEFLKNVKIYNIEKGNIK